MADLMRELVRFADKRGLLGTVPREQRTYSEATGSFHSPTDDKVKSLNSETGDVTLAVSGGLLTISQAGQVITLELTEIPSSAMTSAIVPLANGNSTSPGYLFTPDGAGLLGEVSL